MQIAIATVVLAIWACLVVVAQEKICSTLCSSLGMLQANPGKSCDDIYHVNKGSRGASGNYWINTNTGVHQVYCDMELECGGHKGGWMRIADLDTSRGDDCPSGWTKISTPVAACIAPNVSAGCYSTNFSTLSVPYSKVCGMAVGYEYSNCDAFAAWLFPQRSINGPYVDGVSITYGSPRKHIWTYAIGHSEIPQQGSNCPCFDYAGNLPPSFVHNNYYCESGDSTTRLVSGVFVDDFMWDGEDCSGETGCCSEPSQPWFYRQIPLAVSEDIEARICYDETSSENILVKEFQLYVR